MSKPNIHVNERRNESQQQQNVPASNVPHQEEEKKNIEQSIEKPSSGPDVEYIQPRPFNPELIGNDATCVFFGKRRTGKSFMIRYLLYQKRKVFPYGLVFTKTKFNYFWQNHFPDEYIHKGINNVALANLMERQATLSEKIHQGKLKESMCPKNKHQVNPYVIIVFDDVISDGETMKRNRLIQGLFTEGRHLKTSVYFATQYAKGVSTISRANCDFAFIFKQVQHLQLEALAEDFLGMLPKRVGMHIINKFAEGRQTLVVDCSSNSTNPNEILYVFTAQETPEKFKMGCKEFWKRQDVK
jgi:hypothetical protein